MLRTILIAFGDQALAVYYNAYMRLSAPEPPADYISGFVIIRVLRDRRIFPVPGEEYLEIRHSAVVYVGVGHMNRGASRNTHIGG